MKNNMKIFLVIAVVLMLVTITAASAANTTQDNTKNNMPVQTIEKSNVNTGVETQAVSKETTIKNKNITKKEKNINTKSEAKTIVLNNSNYNDYVNLNGYFNDEVNAGDIIDIQGTIEKPNALNVNKRLHFITSTNDGVLTGANTFKINHNASGSIVDGITFKNVQFTVANASNVRINNVTTLNEYAAIGNGIGSVSIREGSNNITVTNSFFKSVSNGGHSNVVFAVAYNCLFENNTVQSGEEGVQGMLGNIFYLTTYNVQDQPIMHNVNITVRNNIIRGVNILPNQAICVGFMMEGYGHVIENNLIEKDENIMGIQWTDPTYQGEGQISPTETGEIRFVNNTINGNSSVGLGFGGMIVNNTFNTPSTNVGSSEIYGNAFNKVILNNVTVFENNTFKSVGVRDNVNVDFKNAKVDFLNVTGSNNTISNLGVDTNLTTFISGCNNSISNLTIKTTSFVNITNSNNTIKNSKITSEDTFAIEINKNGNTKSTNNIITDNYLVSGLLKGDSAVRNPINNIVANNTPEGAGLVTITDQTYADYFNEQGNIINIPNGSLIAFGGTFNNKNFIFENTNHVITSNGVIFNNATITINGTSRLAFIDAFQINNRYAANKDALIIYSDNNKFNEVTINDDNTRAESRPIQIFGNKNELRYKINSYAGSNNDENPDTCALIVDGNNNIINGYFYVHQGPGNYTGVVFTENSKYNTFEGTLYSFYKINTSGQYGAIISGEGHNFRNVIVNKITTNDSIPFLLNNANNITINGANLQSNGVALLFNNSNNNIIENATNLVSTIEQYPVKLVNSSNNIIRNNFIKNNQTYGGNNAVYEDENSYNNTIIANTNTPVDLSDETYDLLFENGVLINGNIINIVGDLHNKILIFNNAVTINANNHTLYNSPITINSGTNTINNLVMNSSNIQDLITINAKTTINNAKINATETTTILRINNDTTLNSLEINHYNVESRLKTIYLNNALLTAKGVTMNVSGPAIESDEYELGLEDYETDITTIGVYMNGSASIRSSGNFIINMKSTKVTTGKIVAIRAEKESFQGKYSQIPNLNINIQSESDVIGVIGNPEVTGSPIINITGKNVIGIIFNQYYNQSYNGLKLYINAENAIGLYRNKTSYYYDSYPAIRNTQMFINATNTAMGAYIRNTYVTYQNPKFTINAPNVIGYYLDNIHYNVDNHVFTLSGENVTGIKLLNTEIDSRTRRAIELKTNTINITATTARAMEITNVTHAKIESNKIQINQNVKSILVQDSTGINITKNTITNDEFPGNLAVEQENCINTIVASNLPQIIVNLTDENYAEYFQDGTYIHPECEVIELCSDLYNKDLIFTSNVTVNANNYTLYNGTIKVDNNQSVTVSNIIINNIDNRTSSIIVSGFINLKNSSIYQEGDNKQIIRIENSRPGLSSTLTYNNITLKGNDGTIFNITNANMATVGYNNFTTIGDRDMVYSHETSATIGNDYYLRNNNIIVNTTEAVTEIITGEGIRINFIYNNITVNSTQEENPIAILPGYNQMGTVMYNHIISSDLQGKNAIRTNIMEVAYNTPIQKLILTEDNYQEYHDKLSDYDIVELGSDLYNKDIRLAGLITFDGKGYTMYNGTIYTNGNGGIVNVSNLNINNTDNRTSSVVIDNQIIFNNNTIYQKGNNKTVVIIEDVFSTGYINNNNIFVEGDNNTVLSFYVLSLDEDAFTYNNITVIGDRNRVMYFTHEMGFFEIYVQYNNITVYTNEPITEIYSNNVLLYFLYNTVLVNSSHTGIPIIKMDGNDNCGAVYNYIESLDLVGDNAVEAPLVMENTPTDSARKVLITIANETLIPTVETNISISITDMLNNPLTGVVTAKINDEEVEITDNVITYTPQALGEITVEVTYTDPNNKYEQTTQTQVISITKQDSTTNITTEEVVLGDTTNLTAAFYTDEGIPVANGKAIFRVNGKTLRDDKGEVIYVDVKDGKAVLTDVNITGEWMRPDTTIQAICVGSDDVEPIFTETCAVNVTKPVATVEITSQLEATAGKTVTLTAKVTDGQDNINSGRVVFKLNGKTLKDESGKALYVNVVDGVANTTYTIPAKTKAKTYTLEAVFTDNNYERSEASEDYVINKA